LGKERAYIRGEERKSMEVAVTDDSRRGDRNICGREVK